ncbi:hypothetical protein [Streptomyces pseudovenezuelae]|uniref:Uncharacterized protein n=1 Tax=Streptomyces pseudovenezuelae TaxID=67350 RepID=A0ABT6LED8_9ACTN|nr:hypothetical protein [Streptomyces pseudovenezuelae]MDH6214674.1 hypothetical protein [Streptomyces pseudovenezuelae]
MTAIDIEKVRKAAEAATAKLAEAEAAEATRQAEKAAERVEAQREKDAEFLAQWEVLDAELQEVGSKSAADAIYEGTDPIAAVAHFWVERAKRNAIRSHAQSAYYRLHGQHPDDTFARALPERDMRIADRLEEAIYKAAMRHGADLAEKLQAEWVVE